MTKHSLNLKFPIQLVKALYIAYTTILMYN